MCPFLERGIFDNCLECSYWDCVGEYENVDVYGCLYDFRLNYGYTRLPDESAEE